MLAAGNYGLPFETGGKFLFWLGTVVPALGIDIGVPHGLSPGGSVDLRTDKLRRA